MPGIIIPFYAYPKLWLRDNEWTRLATAARHHPSLNIRAVINPANGPGIGVGPDYENYANGITLLRDAGISVVGYVDTDYAAKPLHAVASEITRYGKFYAGSISGIFFDQMAHSPGWESYYLQSTAAAKDAGFHDTIGNPGVLLPPSYTGSCTLLNVYENTGYPDLPGLLANLRSNPNYGSYLNYSVLVYNAETLDVTWLRDVIKYVGYMYVAGHGSERDWDCLPSFFDDFLEQAASLP